MHHHLFLRRTPNTADGIFVSFYNFAFLLWFIILIQNYMIYLSKRQFLNIARTFLICLNLLGSSSGSALTSGKLRSVVGSLCSSFQSALCTVTLTTLQYFNYKSQRLLHCAAASNPNALIKLHCSCTTICTAL